jgi:hypothetical protein
MTWKPIVGRLFKPDEFETYVGSLKFNLWRPKLIVVHNTSAPDLRTWNGMVRRPASVRHACRYPRLYPADWARCPLAGMEFDLVGR